MIIKRIEDISRDSDVGKAVAALVSTQLGNHQRLEATLDQIDYHTGRTILIGGFVDDQLATMNAFMPQTFGKPGHEILGYQSGFSATHGDHRGKGYWPRLLAASEEILRSAGAGFVFGFPNSVSHPLFEKKLNYSTAPMFKAVLPVQALVLTKHRRKVVDIFYCPDIRQTADWKRRSDPEVILVDHDGSAAFGKAKRSRGIRFIDIGGLTGLEDAAIGLICKAAKVSFFRFEWSEPGAYSGSFWPKRYSRPVIFKSLTSGMEIQDVSFTGGLADNF